MNVGVFGSCVSRDTCEFIPEAEVQVYVARQSAVSLLHPHGSGEFALEEMTSSFQQKMVKGDLAGDGIARIKEIAPSLDLILIDLADERRGFWLYPDGTTITNSIEVEFLGIARQASEAGAKLIAFGTDLHFEMWNKGFRQLMRELSSVDLSPKVVFLDIEWASTMDNAKPASSGFKHLVGRKLRKNKRRTRQFYRAVSSRRSLQEIWKALTKVRLTSAEVFAARAQIANRKYRRYRKVVNSVVDRRVSLSSKELRIAMNHKWGAEPFHYRQSDYRSIVKQLKIVMND